MAKPLKSVPDEQAFYISKVKIQLAGNTREISPKKLSSSQTSLSPQRNVSNNSYTTPEKTNSKESLSTSVLSQRSNKPVVGTPRTSTPEPRKSMSPPVGQQSLRGFHHESVLSKVGSHADKRKPFYDSTASKGIDSTQDLSEEKINISPLEFTTQQSQRNEFSLKKHWYYDILQRMEDLSWSYQNLEVEYSFLEKLMAEQKEDLKKAKNWSKQLHNQNASNRTKNVH